MSGREQVIEHLKWIADYFKECIQNASFGSKAEEHFYEIRSAAIDAIKLLKEQEAPTVGQWIGVKDRMPEIGDTVLFTGMSSFGTRFRPQRGWFDGTFWKRDAGETVYTNTPVTHWMPLPEPPEQEEEE